MIYDSELAIKEIIAGTKMDRTKENKSGYEVVTFEIIILVKKNIHVFEIKIQSFFSVIKVQSQFDDSLCWALDFFSSFIWAHDIKFNCIAFNYGMRINTFMPPTNDNKHSHKITLMKVSYTKRI